MNFEETKLRALSHALKLAEEASLGSVSRNLLHTEAEQYEADKGVEAYHRQLDEIEDRAKEDKDF